MPKNTSSQTRKWSGRSVCADSACAEIAVEDGVATLTSTLPDTGQLTLTTDELSVFIEATKRGDLDHLIN